MPAIVGRTRRSFDVLTFPARRGSAGIAIDATEADALRTEVKRMMDANRRTLDQLPTGVAVLAEDLGIRRIGEKWHNVTHWSDFDTGGHFAAMETPQLLVSDIRTFFA